MRKKLTHSLYFGLMCMLAVGCSSEEPIDDVIVPGGDIASEIPDNPAEDEEYEEGMVGMWPAIIWNVIGKSDNVRLDGRNIYVTAPGGMLELESENYPWFILYPPTAYRSRGDLTEEERYALHHISGKNYRVASEGNRVRIEMFDIPRNFTGTLVEFTICPGDRFESYTIVVE